jgi:DNA primase
MTSSRRENEGPDFGTIDVPRLLSLLHIVAKKKGRAWQGQCPSGAHTDKHPSWSMREELGTKRNSKHHCFSCTFGGTAIELVMHCLDLSYWGASDWITERALKKVHPALRVKIELGSPTLTVCSMPAEVRFEPLDKWPSAAAAYVKSRRITAEQVERWGIGYALEGRLSGRFVIPSRDRTGELIGWTARTFTDSPKRYLAASQTDGPDIDSVFGEEHWPVVIGPSDILVITEGALNALAVERTNLPVYVGALSGSHLEPGHALKLSRFKMIVILTDPDPAGDKAAKGLTAMLGRHTSVARARLPEKTDADSTEQKTLEAFLCHQIQIVRAAGSQPTPSEH